VPARRVDVLWHRHEPRLCHILGVIHSCDVAQIKHVSVTESTDASYHHSAKTWDNCGFARPINDPEVPRLLEVGTRVYADGVYLLADGFGVELDAPPEFEYELGACTEDIDLGWYFLPRGSLGACRLRYIGKVGGTPRIESVIELAMSPKTNPEVKIRGCYITKIDADPVIYSKHLILPRPGTDFSTPEAIAFRRHDGHRYACVELSACRRGSTPRMHHERRPTATSLRGQL
jgi:4-hydroxy-tetrahydrodipicolinate reductase